VVLLATAGIVAAALLLSRHDPKSKPAATSTPALAPLVPVPSIGGRSRAAATAALESSGLAVVTATVPGPPAAGQVLAQSPAAGARLKPGASVPINVSNGAQGVHATATAPAAKPAPVPVRTSPARVLPAPVQAPALTGDVRSVVQQLAGNHLRASIQSVPGADPLGTVTAQSPPSASTVTPDSHVTISVSSGPGGKQPMAVPDPAGQTIPQAVETLNRAGLRLILLERTAADQSQAGTVVEQTPKPGTRAPRNAQVLVYMGAYKG
jgi:beta-lactam-binding protein with PASTA domain